MEEKNKKEKNQNSEKQEKIWGKKIVRNKYF